MSDPDWRPPRAFAKRLLAWAADLDRPLPWRGEKDPYRVWLSEMLLQQTRAEQATPYYRRFLSLFPDVHALARAPLSRVLKAWEGLGYYNRAHHLHRAAQYVSHRLQGRFPDTLEGLLALPGVGPYSAAAIASFAFGHPHAVLDGNVIRVLARLGGYAERTDSSPARRELQRRADLALAKADPSAFNQAIMDFGAVQCVPRSPNCPACPFHADCEAYRSGRVALLPVKKTRAALRERHFVFLVASRGHRTWLVRRGEQDVWRALYTFPCLEMEDLPNLKPGPPPASLITELPGWSGVMVRRVSRVYRQVLSHQCIRAVFAECVLPRKAPVPATWIAVENREFTTFAMPKILHMYLSDKASPYNSLPDDQ